MAAKYLLAVTLLNNRNYSVQDKLISVLAGQVSKLKYGSAEQKEQTLEVLKYRKQVIENLPKELESFCEVKDGHLGSPRTYGRLILSELVGNATRQKWPTQQKLSQLLMESEAELLHCRDERHLGRQQVLDRDRRGHRATSMGISPPVATHRTAHHRSSRPSPRLSVRLQSRNRPSP